jgi:hypothetical protein
MNYKASANYYLKKGINVIVTNSVKQSLFDWKKYQSDMITVEDIERQAAHPSAAGMAVICGSVSGGLEVIDIDLKYSLDPEMYAKMLAAVGPLADLLYTVRTRSGGYHWYYRCEVVERNAKLAYRPKTAQELRDNPKGNKICLIETRGEAGYVIAPPTAGYEIVNRVDIPVLTIDQREALWSACRSFNEVEEVREASTSERQAVRDYSLSPGDDYDRRGDVVGLLEKHGWTVVGRKGPKTHFLRPGNTTAATSGNYDHDLCRFSVFTTNSVFEPETAYKPYAVYAILEHNGDFTAAIRALGEAGYGEKRAVYGNKIQKEISNRKASGQSKDQIVTALVQRHGKTAIEASEIVDTIDRQQGDTIQTFWDLDKNGTPVINRTRLGIFLEQTCGYCLYTPPGAVTYRIVQVQGGIVEEVTTEHIRKSVKQYILSLPDSFDGGLSPVDLMEVVLKGSHQYFSTALLEFINRREIDFLRDSSTVAYFPFANGVVVCQAGEDPVLRSYGAVGKHVWASQIIDFDIAIDTEIDSGLVEYYRFLQNICAQDQQRLEYAITIIGYLLHGWKNPSRPFAAILAEETDDEKKGGGTGKGLFIKAISKLIPTVSIDGRNFRMDKSFAFQRVGLDTRLVVIEDCPRNVEFEKFYPTITEGITIEKKNKDEVFLPYSDSPKIAFTTNYSISQDAEHAKRRQRVFEFAPHYSSKRTPEDEFGHKFFDDWDRDEWNRFYNLMFVCLGAYLNNGILHLDNSQKMKRKHIKLAYGEEFLDWVDNFLTGDLSRWCVLTQEYTGFLRSNEFEKKDYSIKRFRKAVQEAVCSLGGVIEFRKNSQNNGASEFKATVKHTGSEALIPDLF